MTSTTTDRPRIAFTCSYVPEEILLAAGLMPVRMLPDRRATDADSHIHPNTCGFLKSLLAEGLNGSLGSGSGIVFANACDGTRKLFDLWRHFVPTVPALFLEVPKKKDPDSIGFFAGELKRFAGDLANGVPEAKPVTPDSLKTAIAENNAIRRNMMEIFSLQRRARPRALGSDIFRLCISKSQSDPGAFLQETMEFLSVVRDTSPPKNGCRNMVLSGGLLNRPDLVSLIEQKGWRVAALDTCLGIRHFEGQVDETAEDPYLALAERYLATRPPCPRMDAFEERYAYLRDLVNQTDAGGVVYCPVKFCDLFLYDVPLLSQRFKKAGIPFLVTEDDYQSTGIEPIKTRVEAFLEMAGQTKEGNDV